MRRRRSSRISRRSSRCSLRRDDKGPEVLILSEALEAHGGDDPPGKLELPKLDDEEVHKALILLWQTLLSTTTSPCGWSSHCDLPLCRQRSPLVISSLVSSKASTMTFSCVNDDLPLVSSLSPPRVHVFCPSSYQWSLFLLIGWWVPQGWEG